MKRKMKVLIISLVALVLMISVFAGIVFAENGNAVNGIPTCCTDQAKCSGSCNGDCDGACGGSCVGDCSGICKAGSSGFQANCCETNTIQNDNYRSGGCCR
ncbi:MAG TPA: hypothetical protein VJ488_03905 [Dehalococcoidia bacterium]|nr:hypothetical protein [Dehalococcoidia bacterium]